MTVAIVHRHGDRTPVRSYATDPYRDSSYWPDGWGQLTSAGKERMYKIGEFFAKHYGDFWPQNIREFHALSSDADRCLESAYLVLAGAFKPTDRWVWNNDLNWVPIAVHTTPRVMDKLLNPSVFCPNADKDFKLIKRSSEYQSYERRFSALYPMLSFVTGEKIKCMVTAATIYGTLKVERENNYTLPSWATPSVLSQLREMYDLKFYFKYLTRTTQRIRTGPFFKELKHRFTTISPSTLLKRGRGSIPLTSSPTRPSFPINSPDIINRRKVFFYSTHDSMMAALLSSLQIFDGENPDYGSSLIFELYRSTKVKDQQLVSIYYLKDSSSESLIKMRLPFCEQSTICDFDIFIDYISSLIPKNWLKECGKTKKQALNHIE